jgi:hypothetical protein
VPAGQADTSTPGPTAEAAASTAAAPTAATLAAALAAALAATLATTLAATLAATLATSWTSLLRKNWHCRSFLAIVHFLEKFKVQSSIE